ncbi:HNH endonuclease [Streptomyces phage Persimmon]|nr:HNH endonuclease [Streptomyces phage Persimmon]
MEKLLEYLAMHPCVDCGEADPIVLEFDHLPEFEKSFEIGRAVTSSTMSWAKVLTEIDKCEVVCCNCHRRRTAKRKGDYRYLASLV